jgi:hypothetical protein
MRPLPGGAAAPRNSNVSTTWVLAQDLLKDMWQEGTSGNVGRARRWGYPLSVGLKRGESHRRASAERWRLVHVNRTVQGRK